MRESLFSRKHAAAALAATLALGLAGEARAADCSTLKNPVYMTGSSAIKGVLAQVAASLVPQATPVTVVYKSSGSCAGVTAVLSSTPITGQASIWDASGVEGMCDLPAAGVQADVGISDVFADTCQSLPNGLPANVVESLGPVQAMTFVVPNKSTQQSISAEAAFFVFGFGTDSGVMPWADPTQFFIRNATSGTQAMIGSAILVPATKWKGTDEGSSGGVLNAIKMANAGATFESAIGVLAADVVEGDNSGLIKVLAYQHFGQNCGYYPNSDSIKHDKRNVRDGHYAIWGPLHLFKRTDVDVPNQANIQKAIDYVTGAQDPGIDLIKFEAQHSVVPQCAMRVKRKQEVGVGSIQAFSPDKPCGCYYEYVANQGAAGADCTMCQTSGDCPTGYSCPLYGDPQVGFCEAP